MRAYNSFHNEFVDVDAGFLVVKTFPQLYTGTWTGTTFVATATPSPG